MRKSDGRLNPRRPGTTLWVGRDRQGTKWFRAKPVFRESFALLDGERVPEPVITNGNRKEYVIIRNFRVRVV